MNFLGKLNYLMESNHLNKSTLSKACDIPYTTIDGWYKKGYEGVKLTTLRKLASYFGTSLDFWASDEIIDVKYGVSKSNNFQFSGDTLDVATAYDQAEFKDKNTARCALGLPLIEEKREQLESKQAI